MNFLPCPESVPLLLKDRAEKTGGQRACCYRNGDNGWQPMTWGHFWTEVQRVASAFRRHGLCRGDRLAIVLPPSVHWELAHQAGLLLGATVVGVETSLPREQLEFVLADSDVSAVVVDQPATWERIPPRIKSRIRVAVVIAAKPEPHQTPPLIGWGDLQRNSEIQPQLTEGPNADDPAALIYTSGTTGTPKAIQYTHRQLLVACMAILDAFPELKQGDRTVCWLPMSHLFQRMVNLLAFARGMVVYYLEDPREIMGCLDQVKPSLFAAVPRFYEKLSDHLRENPHRTQAWVGAVKVALTGSAPMPARLLEALKEQGLVVLEAYGLSENTVPVAMNRNRAYRFGSVGKVLAPNEIGFAPDGEILVRGPGLFHGYLNSETSQGRFADNGFFRTGDCGRRDQDGFLYLTARKSDIIKTSTGRRISPARIEAVYQACPLVDRVVMVGNGRKHLSALVCLNLSAVNDALAGGGSTPLTAEQACESPEVRQLVEECFNTLGGDLAAFERAGSVTILPRPLSMAEGELTSSQKLRRPQIERNFAKLIDSDYAAGNTTVGSDE